MVVVGTTILVKNLATKFCKHNKCTTHTATDYNTQQRAKWIDLELQVNNTFSISTDAIMSDRRLMFYFLLDLLPILVVAVVLLVAALSFALCLIIRSKYPAKKQESSSKCECKPPCPCRQDCECCGTPLSTYPIMDTVKDLLAWAIESLFTYAWNEREKEKKNVNEKSKVEQNDESQNKESEVKEKESKSGEKHKKDLNIKHSDYKDDWVLAVFILAAALCLVSSFILLWDSMLVRVRQDNCVTGLDCYIFNGRGCGVLYSRPLNCSNMADQPEKNNTADIVFCYSIQVDLVRGASAAGGGLFSSACQFLTFVAVESGFSKHSCCSTKCLHCLTIVPIVTYIVTTWSISLTMPNPQVFFLADITKPLQLIITTLFYCLALNIPWYRTREDDKKKSDKNGNSKESIKGDENGQCGNDTQEEELIRTTIN